MKTTTEIELRKWAAEGKSVADIAALCAVSKPQASNTLRMLGITMVQKFGMGRGRLPRTIDLESVMADFGNGLSFEEICRKVGFSDKGLRRRLMLLGYPSTPAEYWKRRAKGLPLCIARSATAG